MDPILARAGVGNYYIKECLNSNIYDKILYVMTHFGFKNYLNAFLMIFNTTKNYLE